MKALSAVVIIALSVFCASPLMASFEYDEGGANAEDIANWLAQAKQGNAEAEYNLGEAYLKGEGVKQDEKEAAKWYERAANQGYPDAERAMGFVYRGGGGRPMNKILSYMWFDLAVQNDDEGAEELRNDVAWSMTQEEIEEARKKESEWKPKKEHHNTYDQ